MVFFRGYDNMTFAADWIRVQFWLPSYLRTRRIKHIEEQQTKKRTLRWFVSDTGFPLLTGNFQGPCFIFPWLFNFHVQFSDFSIVPGLSGKRSSQIYWWLNLLCAKTGSPNTAFPFCTDQRQLVQPSLMFFSRSDRTGQNVGSLPTVEWRRCLLNALDIPLRILAFEGHEVELSSVNSQPADCLCISLV